MVVVLVVLVVMLVVDNLLLLLVHNLVVTVGRHDVRLPGRVLGPPGTVVGHGQRWPGNILE